MAFRLDLRKACEGDRAWTHAGGVPTVITTIRLFREWNQIIADDLVAHLILDRLAERTEREGMMRKAFRESPAWWYPLHGLKPPFVAIGGNMERSADWMEQARGDLEHARHDLAGGFFPTGSPRRRYTKVEAERMLGHADEILRFCEGLLSTL